MTSHRNREEVINTQLAILISRMGVEADAETIHVHGKHRPDVLFRMHGLRIVIEGKFADHPAAEKVVLNDARNRVKAGIAHIAMAAIYPEPLRTTATAKVTERLENSQIKYRIISEAHESEDWFEGNPASLMSALRRAHEGLTKDDVVEQTAKELSVQLQAVAALWSGQAGACDRLSTILGFARPKKEEPEKAHERRETAAKVSALVLANAFIFQEQLARTDERVAPLRKHDKEDDVVGAAGKHWRWIWENINYVPIFQLGERVLDELPASPHTTAAVRALLNEAISICSRQAALRHDLMGRIYHWLLHYAKYLGTYYTAVPSATLLLKLAMAANWQRPKSDSASAKGEPINFGNPVDLAGFKVADLACGTGTLLMAAAQALSDLYILTRAANNQPLEQKNLQTLHRTLMENVLHGYDVLPSALHLTASTLAMLAPEVAFIKMNLYIMPMGLDRGNARLGSLDFLDTDEVQTQVALDYSQIETIRTGAAASYVTNAKVPKLNLCVMNPPFTRSVGGNLLFGSLPDERGTLQAALRKQVKDLPASTTAGLGSVFITVADRRLTYKGRLAFVLPAAIVSGEAWSISRQLIADRYHLETVIASHDAKRPNFSENTDLSEVLFIARKLSSGEKSGRTTYTNLWRNPRTIHEAIDLANRIEHLMDSAVSVEGTGVTSIRGISGKLGEIVTTPAPRGKENWTGALFSQTDLLRTWFLLHRGIVRVPGDDTDFHVPVCPLSVLGELGYDRRDIHDAFETAPGDWTPYPAFWGHDASKVRTIAQKPNNNLSARTKAAKGRKMKSAQAVWQKAGPILLAERIRFNTHRCMALGFSKPVLGNTWWSVRTDGLSEQAVKALLLWLNSSLAVLLYFSRRVVTEGAFVGMKKPAWSSMPVLDVRNLAEEQLETLAAAYDELSDRELMPLAQLDDDETRGRIDSALCEALEVPDLTSIRELLAREPGLSAVDINGLANDDEVSADLASEVGAETA
jgi:hypothetical protein